MTRTHKTTTTVRYSRSGGQFIPAHRQLPRTRRGTIAPRRFSGPDALHIYRAFFGFLNGHVLNELQELVENPDETDDLLRLGMHRLPLSEFPLLRSLAHALACYDGAAELERGLDILIIGLATTLPPAGGGRPPGSAPHDASDKLPSDGGRQ
jgi:hypothetical protein